MTRATKADIRAAVLRKRGNHGVPDTLRELVVPIDSLNPYERNPRRGNVDVIAESLQRHGQYRPIVVRSRTDEVLAGNHTVAAALQLGWQQIAATYIDVDDDTAKRIVLIDNRANDIATNDDELLAELLQDLPDLAGTGYDSDDLDALLDELGANGNGGGLDPGADTEPIEPPEQPQTRAGDLYALGHHRLLCGNSLDMDDLDRIFGGVTPGSVLTDPPYGINLSTEYVNENSRRVARWKPVEGDEQPFDASSLREYFAAVAEQFWWGANYYRRTLSDDDMDGSWLVWDKRNPDTDVVIGAGFELCWSAQKHKQDVLRYLWTNYSSHENDGHKREHPTEKPIAMLAEIISRWTKDGIIADPFGGSGATLIAAENLNQPCYIIEIDPAYCDVIVNRWERHTDREVELIEELEANNDAN